MTLTYQTEISLYIAKTIVAELNPKTFSHPTPLQATWFAPRSQSYSHFRAKNLLCISHFYLGYKRQCDAESNGPEPHAGVAATGLDRWNGHGATSNDF